MEKKKKKKGKRENFISFIADWLLSYGKVRSNALHTVGKSTSIKQGHGEGTCKKCHLYTNSHSVWWRRDYKMIATAEPLLISLSRRVETFLRSYVPQYTVGILQEKSSPDKQWSPTVQHRELYPSSSGRTWRKIEYIYEWMNEWMGHYAVQQNLTQYYKSTIL